jgi:proline iminopeptidase
VFSPLPKPWYRKWGATEAETRRPLPGDELVTRSRSGYTAAVTVRGTPAQVWPWFVQLGCQRAGWYSYDLLDNGGKPSAGRIIPEYQHLALGDLVKALPNGSFGFPVAILLPDQALVLGGTVGEKTVPDGKGGTKPGTYFSGVQTFCMQAMDSEHTRLFFRLTTDWNPGLMNTIAYRVFLEPISFVMGRKLLKTVKQRVETTG